jgi:hypothetical protein
MSAFLLTATGDLDQSSGGLKVIDGAQQVLQQIRSNLRTFLGEYFLDTSLGVPYIQTIFAKGTGQGVIEGLLKQQILGVDGVIQINSFTLTLDNKSRLGTLNFSVLTTNGVVTATETI